MKCGIVADDRKVLAIIRRWDLDTDARLSKSEFFEGITPQEAYTKKTSDEIKFKLEIGSLPRSKRPKTASTR